MGKVLLYGTVLISDRLGYNTTNSVWPGYNVIVINPIKPGGWIPIGKIYLGHLTTSDCPETSGLFLNRS